MATIRALVIDDERNGRENLMGILGKYCPEVEVIGEASSLIEAINQIEKTDPSLIFLDIEMPNGSGFEVLKHFDHPKFKIIFVTAFDHYAIRAVKFSALDYILKPIDIVELKDALKRYKQLIDKSDTRLDVFKQNVEVPYNEKKIAITSNDKIDFIKIKDIVLCKGDGGYTRISLIGDLEILSSKPLIVFEELLEGFGFIRTHKANLVNSSHVISYVKKEGGYLEMSSGEIIPVSRRKKDQVLTVLKDKNSLK